jgi:hypothetical protein
LVLISLSDNAGTPSYTIISDDSIMNLGGFSDPWANKGKASWIYGHRIA